MIEIIGTGNIFLMVFLFGIGLFGISIGGIFSSLFGGGSRTSSSADVSAREREKAERDHQLLMAKQATELAAQKAVVAEAQSKKTLMYVGIGGGLFMVMMMMMMMRK